MFAINSRMKHSFMLGLLFFVVSSPYTYTFVDNVVSTLVGGLFPSLAHLFKVADNGCPTTYGLLLHAGVFSVVAYVLHSV
jgi:hypothetical protein